MLLLFLYDTEEFVTLSLSLLGHHDFFLDELPSSGDVKFPGLFTGQLGLLYLISARLAFALLERSLGPERVDLTLTVCGTLLKLSKALNLQLFLLFNALGLTSIGLFFSDSLGIVTHDFQIFITLLSELFLFAIKGDFVGDFDLLEHLSVSGSLSFLYYDILLLLLLNGPHHLLLLALELLTLLDALHFTLLNLLNDYSCAASLGLNSQAFSLILSLECLQALNFHHKVQAFLLIDPLRLQMFILLQLLVSHSDDLGI